MAFRNRGYRPRNDNAPRNAMVPVFRHLADKFMDYSHLPESRMACIKLHLPYVPPDGQVRFDDYFGDIYGHLIAQSPLTISYHRTQSANTETRQRIKSMLRGCLESLHNLTEEENACIELDFVETAIVKMNSSASTDDQRQDTKKLSVADVESLIKSKDPRLKAYQLRMCLPEGEQILIDLLEGLGATVKQRKDAKGKVICECFPKGFSHQSQSFGGCLNLDPDNLAFASWNVCRSLLQVHLLSNPGPEQDVEEVEDEDDTLPARNGNLRLKALIRFRKKKDELLDSTSIIIRRCPTKLTTANLGGLLQRDERNKGFQGRPNGGIMEVTETFNKVRYKIEMDGFSFLLNVADGAKYRLDRYTGKSVLTQKLSRWPKFKFPVPSKDSTTTSNYIEMVTVIVEEFLNALGDGRICPKVWETNVICNGSETIPSTRMQEVRRRIATADDLEGMLDVPARSSKDTLAAKVDEILTAVKKETLFLPQYLITKLKTAAEEREKATE